MKRKLLLLLFSNSNKNKNKDYKQTWYHMPRNPLVRKFIQCLCGWFGGHELSKTEWGYGGGETADRNCRWCDKLIKVPKDSIRFQFKETDVKGLMDKIGKSL